MKTNKRYLVLDQGFIEVEEITESDDSIVKRARISTKQNKKFRPTKELLRYFIKHNHSSPFGFPDIKLYVRCPKFCREQWFRHRSAWRDEGEYPTDYLTTTDNNVSQYHDMQEFSGRYAVYEPMFYLPPIESLTKPFALQKQARGDERIDNAEEIRERMQKEQQLLVENYKWYLECGLAREVARINLPFSLYIDFHWKQNLFNLLHWLELRRNVDVQWETRAYAEVIEQIIADYFPLTYEAWKDYADGVKLSVTDLDELYKTLDGVMISESLAKRLKFVK